MRIGNTEAICAAVAGFELDVGLIEGSVTHPDLRLTPWLHDELVLVASPRLFRNRARVSVLRLQQARWLLREPGSGTREVTDRHLLPVLGSYRYSMEFGSSEAIVAAAAAGLGIACLSRWVVGTALARHELKWLRTSLAPIVRDYAIVIHRDKYLTPALERCLDILLQ